MKYVEHHFIYGWDDAGWQEEGRPMRFDTPDEAQEAIDDLISESVRAFHNNDMCEAYLKEQYRVVEADRYDK